jgi:hypothetical protein
VFVVGYLAFSIPAIGAGVAVGALGLARTTEVYGAAVIVLALSAAGALVLRGRRAALPVPVTHVDDDAAALAA